VRVFQVGTWMPKSPRSRGPDRAIDHPDWDAERPWIVEIRVDAGRLVPSDRGTLVRRDTGTEGITNHGWGICMVMRMRWEIGQQWTMESRYLGISLIEWPWERDGGTDRQLGGELTSDRGMLVAWRTGSKGLGASGSLDRGGSTQRATKSRPIKGRRGPGNPGGTAGQGPAPAPVPRRPMRGSP
jgi:hypothetical protein